MEAGHYVIGDHVHVSKRSFSGPVTKDEFEILGKYPVEGAEPMFRLRNLRLQSERMVPQKELRR
jgi:hypothetical protein